MIILFQSTTSLYLVLLQPANRAVWYAVRAMYFYINLPSIQANSEFARNSSRYAKFFLNKIFDTTFDGKCTPSPITCYGLFKEGERLLSLSDFQEKMTRKFVCYSFFIPELVGLRGLDGCFVTCRSHAMIIHGEVKLGFK